MAKRRGNREARKLKRDKKEKGQVAATVSELGMKAGPWRPSPLALLRFAR